MYEIAHGRPKGAEISEDIGLLARISMGAASSPQIRPACGFCQDFLAILRSRQLSDEARYQGFPTQLNFAFSESPPPGRCSSNSRARRIAGQVTGGPANVGYFPEDRPRGFYPIGHLPMM